METFQIQFDFAWVIYQTPFFVLFIHITVYVYINIFNYYILQHIIYVCIYPRWLEMFIDKDSGFHYNLTETQEKTGKDRSSNSTHHTTGMWKNTSNKPRISSKQKHSNKMQLQRLQENTTTTRKYNIDHNCFAISRLLCTTWMT